MINSTQITTCHSVLILLAFLTSVNQQAFAQVPVAIAAHTFPDGGRSFSIGGAGMATDGAVFDNVIGQTFVAEEAGTLFDISFIATRPESTDADLRVDITDVSLGQPGNIMGTVYVDASEFELGFLSGNPDTFNKTVNLAAAGISVVQGRQYAFLLSTDTTEANYRIYGDRSGYAGGDWMRSQNGSAFTSSNSDLFFRVTVGSSPDPILGDVDRSGTVNFLDISPFIAILAAGSFQDEADCDGNDVVNFLDIAPFIAFLNGQ